ncbi:MAG: hypothetical protein HYZ27_04225, partial [Deltaproteobacteria bacterium]|nr:hypothetical protein [Deltaproteobacteria bacterium]
MCRRTMCLWVMLGVVACSGEEPRRRPGGGGGISSTNTAIDDLNGGIAASPDGLFWVEFPPNALSEDATVLVSQGVGAPVPNAQISQVYRVQLSPQTVFVQVGSDVVFAVTAAQVASAGGSGNLAVGHRTATAGLYDSLLNGIYDQALGQYSVSTLSFSDFGLIDEPAYTSCTCDASSACDAGCGCDPDCFGIVCGDGAIDPGEECDGGNLGGATCVGLGFSGGTLSCSNCIFNT